MLTLSGAGQPQNGVGIEERFVISVKTDNAGTSLDNQFTLPTNGSGYNYDIKYDGQTLTGQTGSVTLTFPSGPGTYDVKISGSFPQCSFANGGDKAKLLDIKNFGIYALGSTTQENAFRGCSNLVISATDIGYFENVTTFKRAWEGCSSLTSLPVIDTSSCTSFDLTWAGCSNLISFPLLNTSSGTNFNQAWQGCSSLTSFPLINTSNATNFRYTWSSCSSLTSFPLLDTSSVTSINGAWSNCSGLTSFPQINTSNVSRFSRFGAEGAWRFCSSLTSFPLLDFSNGTDFGAAWYSCSNLTSFPANAFDTNIATNYPNAFTATNLTTQSIDDILVSIDTSGTINGTFTQSGGEGPSYVGSEAISSLVAKGWTIVTVAPVVSPEFVIQVKTDNVGTSADNEFSLPWIGTYDIDWGDGVVETGLVDTQTHTYPSAGTYDVKVTAATGRIYFNNSGDKSKLLYIKNWGTCQWTSMDSAFNGCSEMDIIATNIPDFTNLTSLGAMFKRCLNLVFNDSINSWDLSNVERLTLGYHSGIFSGAFKFNQPLNGWDVSNVTTMQSLFGDDAGNNIFNQPLNNWDVSNVTDMDLMFRKCSNFNQPLDNWDVSSVTNMRGMFHGCEDFDQNIGMWDVSNVNRFSDGFMGMFSYAKAFNNGGSPSINNWDVSKATQFGGRYSVNSGLFSGASSFNQPLDNWNVSNVTDMRNVFRGTLAFNQPLDNWDVSNVTNMKKMFESAAVFEQSLAAWNINQVADFSDFMHNATLPRQNYDSTLISWAAQTPQLNQSIRFGSSQYTLGGAAETARNTLINTYGWTITDGGGVNVPISGLLFDYPNPERAYSLRQLAGYGGGLEIPVIRVRRAIDNTEQDFTANQITDGTLTTFTGINDGFVVKVYDQNNIFHISQTTANRQAKIVNAGSLLLENGKPTMTTIAGYDYVYGDSTLDYYTNKDTFTYTINKLDSSLTNNNEMFIDNAGGAHQGRTGFSLASNYARINYNGTISSISYDRYLTEDILQPLVWESYPADSVLNNRLKLYNQNGLLADGNVSNTTPTGQGSNRWLTFFGAEGGTYLAPEGNWQETILYKEENIPNRDNFLTSIDEYYNFPATSGLLADYPGASAAYSLRNLANNVTNVVRVRRSSDNTEQDFTSAEITDGTLATFCSGTDGFVTTWYDQSGNSNNASTPVALQQYLIVDNGVIYMSDGKPAIVNLNSSNKFLGWNEFTAVTVISVSKQIGAYSKLQCLFSRNYGNNTANERAIRRDDQSPYQNWNVVGNTQDWFVPANGDWYSNNILKTSDYTNPDTELLFLTNAGSQTYSISRIGDGGSTGRSIKSAIQEVIIYPTDQSANRAGIEANINTEYDIYEGNYLLEDYPGASAAYSLRNLIDTTTSVVRVRRSNDNTEQNFTETEITDGTLTTFTGVNDGFVVTWYDQSGNSNNATQSVAIAQPKIVSNGVVLFSNNKPSLRFKEGSTKRYFNHPLTNELNSSFSILSVVKADGNGSQYEGLLATNTMMKLARVNNGNWGTYPNGVTGTNLYTSTINLITMISSDGGTGNFYTNNTSDGSFTNTDSQTRKSIGGIGNQEFNGFISEMIIYPTDQSLNRIGIETNINTKYTIY